MFQVKFMLLYLFISFWLAAFQKTVSSGGLPSDRNFRACIKALFIEIYLLIDTSMAPKTSQTHQAAVESLR